ncbi:MAG: sporulation protein YunB [Bacilli bacterium]
MYLKSQHKKNKLSILLISIFLSVILSLVVINYLGSKITSKLMTYAEDEASRFASLVINKTVTKKVISDLNIEELFIIFKNNDGDIQSIDFNPITVNKILGDATALVQKNLKHIEEGNMTLLKLDNYNNLTSKKLKEGIIAEIPIGMSSNNSLISNLGPKIPVRIKLLGEVNSSVTTSIENYGINNALIQIFIHLEVGTRVIMPFQSKKVIVGLDIPLGIKILQGKVPGLYNNYLNKNSPVFG